MPAHPKINFHQVTAKTKQIDNKDIREPTRQQKSSSVDSRHVTVQFPLSPLSIPHMPQVTQQPVL